MKIYTKTGDMGETSLVDGSRVSKAHVRIQAVGALDEANAYLGWLGESIQELKAEKELLTLVQSLLFSCGARLAEPGEKSNLPSRLPDQEAIRQLELSIDHMTALLSPLNRFILPGGTEAACRAHIARSVVRRAERILIMLKESRVSIEPEILQYINRLSDWLFTFARFLNYKDGIKEKEWSP